jgi:hypothetical protein
VRAPNRPSRVRVNARAAAARRLSCLRSARRADGHDALRARAMLGYRIGGQFEQQNGSTKYSSTRAIPRA